MSSLNHLADLFERFPGIGPRQAQRFVQFLLRQSAGYTNELADTIRDLRTHTKLCERSYVYFYSDDLTQTLSPIERDPMRDRTRLMIVEKDSDVDNIERIGAYNGMYFVLGGTIPLLSSKQTDHIRLKQFEETMPERVKEGLKEVILATSATPDGDASAELIIRSLSTFRSITISKLARGLSTGTELEYVDKDTLKAAIEHRG